MVAVVNACITSSPLLLGLPPSTCTVGTKFFMYLLEFVFDVLMGLYHISTYLFDFLLITHLMC